MVCADAFMSPVYDSGPRNYRLANVAYYAARNYNDIKNLPYYNDVFQYVNYRWK